MKNERMNMKEFMKTIHLIIYSIFLLSATSCENEIPYTPPFTEPQLIMNALLDAGEPENYIYLNLSGVEGLSHVEKAAVTLYVNGQFAETAEELPALKPIGSLDMVYDPNAPLNNLPEIAKRKKFRITTALNPGDNIRIEAVAEDGKYRTAAEVTVPQPVSSIGVDTGRTKLKYYDTWDTYRQFKITLHDRPGEKNYYRLDIRHDVTTHGLYNNHTDTVIHNRETELINREDIVLTDGNPSSNDNEDDDFFGTYIVNKYNVFTDSHFRDATYTLKVYTPLYNNYQAGNIYQVSRISRAITVRLLSISEAEYRYLKALNYLESDNYDETLMEPVIIPSNVKGGLGFVGISSEARHVMEFPDVTFDHENIYTK